MTNLFNSSSYKAGRFPQKVENVQAWYLFHKGDMSSPSNYRPILAGISSASPDGQQRGGGGGGGGVPMENQPTRSALAHYPLHSIVLRHLLMVRKCMAAVFLDTSKEARPLMLCPTFHGVCSCLSDSEQYVVIKGAQFISYE